MSEAITKERALAILDRIAADAEVAGIEGLSAVAREVRAYVDDAFPASYVLPCDVAVAPATRITKGCTLRTLMSSITLRENAEEVKIEPGSLRGILGGGQ